MRTEENIKKGLNTAIESIPETMKILKESIKNKDYWQAYYASRDLNNTLFVYLSVNDACFGED